MNSERITEILGRSDEKVSDILLLAVRDSWFEQEKLALPLSKYHELVVADRRVQQFEERTFASDLHLLQTATAQDIQDQFNVLTQRDGDPPVDFEDYRSWVMLLENPNLGVGWAATKGLELANCMQGGETSFLMALYAIAPALVDDPELGREVILRISANNAFLEVAKPGDSEGNNQWDYTHCLHAVSLAMRFSMPEEKRKAVFKMLMETYQPGIYDSSQLNSRIPLGFLEDVHVLLDNPECANYPNLVSVALLREANWPDDHPGTIYLENALAGSKANPRVLATVKDTFKKTLDGNVEELASIILGAAEPRKTVGM